jgi:diaminohydroxyphosphoribosylaminopyrimidine deaminase/5-amino-6-(5-phosphoribosylamino)uracil reductase
MLQGATTTTTLGTVVASAIVTAAEPFAGASVVALKAAAALLRQGLVDRLVWFHAPAVMGGDGHPATEGLRLAALSAMPRFRRTALRAIGDDMLSEFERIED